jgi:hypothetical protein
MSRTHGNALASDFLSDRSVRGESSPLYITNRNALALTGSPFTWVCRRAAELGVPVLKQGRKRLIEVAPYMAAVRASVANDAVETDPAEAVRGALRGETRGAPWE